VRFDRIVAKNVDFSDGEYLFFSARRSLFERCHFDRIRVDNGNLSWHDPPQTLFRECSFEHAKFGIGVGPGLARFERCSFNGATFEEWFAFCSEFVDCTFAGARLDGCKFTATPFECWGWLQWRGRRKRNDFYGNDFREAELIETMFLDGIDLDAQRLPESSEYVRVNDALERIENVRVQIASWDDTAAARSVSSVLKVLEYEATEQRDVFVRKADLDYDMPSELSASMWQLLGVTTGGET
jgi:uncharacterized protein YjbI with pentapeptide repeats